MPAAHGRPAGGRPASASWTLVTILLTFLLAQLIHSPLAPAQTQTLVATGRQDLASERRPQDHANQAAQQPLPAATQAHLSATEAPTWSTVQHLSSTQPGEFRLDLLDLGGKRISRAAQDCVRFGNGSPNLGSSIGNGRAQIGPTSSGHFPLCSLPSLLRSSLLLCLSSVHFSSVYFSSLQARPKASN